MRRLPALAATAALLLVTLPGPALAADPGVGRCVDGTMQDGTYSGFVVTGTCTIARGANVQINGNLVIAAGAMLDDHGAEGWMHSQIHVTGNIHVRRNAVLGLGWNSPNGEGSLGPDTVGGNIIATRPRAMQIGGVTIGGNLVSVGGGVASTAPADFRNFPIKDNVIHGNLLVEGWRGGWFGVIRNTIDGNAVILNVVSRSTPEGPGVDTDSTEIMGTHMDLGGGTVIDIPQTIGGNLVCLHNVPAAQYNPADGGAPNVVGGNAIGECAAISS